MYLIEAVVLSAIGTTSAELTVLTVVWRRLSELFCVVLCTEAVHSHKHT